MHYCHEHVCFVDLCVTCLVVSRRLGSMTSHVFTSFNIISRNQKRALNHQTLAFKQMLSENLADGGIEAGRDVA